jgi:mono/diheme cytochrome c family protein
MKRTVIFVFIASLAVALASPALADDDTAALYKSKCQMCHGPDGKGETPAGKKFGAKDFHSADVVKASDDQLFKSIKNGKGKMPAQKITDDQIKALIKYIRSMK